MHVSAKAVALIKQFEGYRDRAYLCPAGKWTIGYGHTGPDVTRHTTCSPESAEDLLLKDLERFVRAVTNAVRVPLTQPQFDALVCFVYNVGTGAFYMSTMLRLINQGKYLEAAEQFLRWNKATVNGKKVEVFGLTRRRQAERTLFLEGCKDCD